jgi:predicted TIM-barrel fold metal-dependent hydrolase
MTYPSILDTHLHIIDRDVLTYPWLADAPALNHDFRLESYQAEAVRCGIGSALHMEADVAEDQIEAESEQVKRLAARSARADPSARTFPPFLSANSPIRWSRASAACCMSFPTT